jgi:hypothetical protein
VELVLRWIKIGLAFLRLVDQKGIGENTGRFAGDRQTLMDAILRQNRR